MSESPRAVFLSYASQDAEAAQRICDALRAAGVEVWFDRNELVGGDAWDAKIRKQIAECALFLPIISANTQARREGYFRIEWRLAAQRTHGMSDDTPFLLPIVIDDTKDADARVPAEFKTVQWTRLPSGEAAEKLCTRVSRLLQEGTEPDATVPATLRAPAPERARGSRAWALGLGLLGVVLALGAALAWWAMRPPSKAPGGVASVAVLPFSTLGGEKEQEYFSDGFTEEVQNALAAEPGLRVAARTSSFSFRGRSVPLAEIARALQVEGVIEGSVQRVGDRLRVRAQFTRVSDGFSESLGAFDGSLQEVFALQDKVARAAVEKLTRRRTAVGVVAPTVDVAAYDLYLRGRALQVRAAGYAAEAAKFYEQAVARDPNFALAWARLAEVRLRPYFGMIDRSPAVIEGAREAFERALAVSADLPEALIVRANWRRVIRQDYAGATEDLARVAAQRPASPDLHAARAALARDQGDWEAARRESAACIELDPQNGDAVNAQALTTFMTLGDYAVADGLFVRAMQIQGPGALLPWRNRIFLRAFWRGPEAALRLIDRAPPGQVGVELVRAQVLVSLGRMDEARTALERGDSAVRDNRGSVAGAVGRVDANVLLLQALGRDEEARKRAEEIRAEALREFARGNRAPLVRLQYATAEIVLGHHDAALAMLAEWREEASQLPRGFRHFFEYGQFAAAAYAQCNRPDEAMDLIEEATRLGLEHQTATQFGVQFGPLVGNRRFEALIDRRAALLPLKGAPVDDPTPLGDARRAAYGLTPPARP
jgi:TolB-like protein